MIAITINITDEQERYLKMFAANHYPGSRDNIATNKPIHSVQTQRERVVDPDYDSPDIVRYVLHDRAGCEDYDSVEEMVRAYYEHEDCPIPIVSFKEAYAKDRFTDINGEEQVIFQEQEYLEAYGITEELYYKVNFEKYYESVAFFFILAEARRYMEYQKHNLRNPRTYTFGPGYANKGEYEHFWDLLFSIGKMLNEERCDSDDPKARG